MAFAHNRSRVPRSEEASNSANATMPVSGVRISCAMPASAASTARAAGFFAGRARVLRGRLLGLCFAMGPPDPMPTMTRKPRSIEPDGSAYVGRGGALRPKFPQAGGERGFRQLAAIGIENEPVVVIAVSYTHLRAHETDSYLVCR